MRITIVAMLAALTLAAPQARAAGAKPPAVGAIIRHDDFERDSTGTMPKDWGARRSLKDGYRIEVATAAARTGRQGLAISMDHAPGSGVAFGSTGVRIPAEPFRGRRIKFEGWGRFIPQSGLGGGKGQFWVRVDRPNGLMGGFDNMDDRPIATDTWTQGVITVDVAADADTVLIGGLMTGVGRFEMDDLVLTALGKFVESIEPAGPLSDRGLANLMALGRLASVVRFFHPSDSVEKLEWNRFLVDAVDAVEPAPTPAALATALKHVFAPIAPTVTIATSAISSKSGQISRAGATRRVGWENVGFGASARRSVYSSERQFAPIDSMGGPLPLGATWSGNLGGGVFAAVPLSLPADERGALPRPAAPAPKPAAVRPAGWSPSGRDRATRLGDILTASGVLAQFFPYADVVSLDLERETRQALLAAATSKDEGDFTRTVERFAAALHDGHGYVSGPGQPWLALPLRFEFVGDELAVVATAPGAGEARIGDVVTRINGRPIAEVVADMRDHVSFATEGFFRYRCATQLAKSNTATTFTLRTPDGATRTVTVTPGDAQPPRLAKPDSIAEVKPGIWYVDLDRISDNDWSRELTHLSKAHGIVFDLRGYPRTSTLPMMSLVKDSLWCARWYVPRLRRPFFEAAEWDSSGRWPVRGTEPHLAVPVAFVVDGRAVSYAETWMGMVEAGHLGTIVGEPTAGTNGNIANMLLLGGYSLTFTGMKTLKHDYSRHHGVGIHPDIPVSRTIAGLVAGRDEALEKAIEVVSRRQ
jgi:hypothetical protein